MVPLSKSDIFFVWSTFPYIRNHLVQEETRAAFAKASACLLLSRGMKLKEQQVKLEDRLRISWRIWGCFRVRRERIRW